MVSTAFAITRMSILVYPEWPLCDLCPTIRSAGKAVSDSAIQRSGFEFEVAQVNAEIHFLQDFVQRLYLLSSTVYPVGDACRTMAE